LGHELAVGQLVGAGPEVVHPGLDRDGHRERSPEVADRGDGGPDARRRLAGRQEEPRREARGLVEAQVLAQPRRLEPRGSLAQERELGRLRAHRAAHRRADAVEQLPPGQAEEVPKHLLVHPVRLPASRRLDPGRLGLDLQDVDDPGVAPEERLDRARVGDPDAEGRDLSGSAQSP
jgi:hypothetical protein